VFYIFQELGFINMLAFFVPIEYTPEIVENLEEAWCQSNPLTSSASIIIAVAINAREMYDAIIVITH
jgi:hypothetical protein